MGVFEKNIMQAKDLEEFWKKSSKRFSKEKRDHSELSGITSFVNRLSNPTYLNNTNSKAIQPVIKIVSKQTGTTQVRRLLDYIAREAELEKEHLSIESDEMGEYKTRSQREELIKEWKNDFANKEKYEKQNWKLEILENLEKKREKLIRIPEEKRSEEQINKIEKLSHQIDNQYTFKKVKDKDTGLFKEAKQDLKIRVANDTTHVLLSVGGKPNEKKATQATRKFLKDNLSANGFKYIFVKHNDTDNLHYHVVIKNKSEFGKNLRFDKADLFALRQEYARSLSINGIERVSTLRKDRAQILENLQKSIGNIKERDTWYQNQLKKDPERNKGKDKSKNFDVFSYRAGLLKQTQYLIENTQKQIKNYGGDDKKALKEDLKYLQSFKKDIQIESPEEIKIAKEKTINYLSKDNKSLIDKVKDLNINKEESKEKRISSSEKRRRNKYLNTLMKKHIEDLKQAKKIVSVHKEGIENKEEHKKTLKTLDTMIKNSKSIMKGKGKTFGLKGM